MTKTKRMGRPKKAAKDKAIQLAVYVPPHVKRDWEARAREEMVSLSHWILERIEKGRKT